MDERRKKSQLAPMTGVVILARDAIGTTSRDRRGRAIASRLLELPHDEVQFAAQVKADRDEHAYTGKHDPLGGSERVEPRA